MTSGKGLVVFGGGGHGTSVVDVAQRSGWTIVAIVDPKLRRLSGTPIERRDEDGMRLAEREQARCVVAIGEAGRRQRIGAGLVHAGLSLATIVASTATVGARTTLDPGVVVMEHAHVGPDAHIGRMAIVNTGAVVEHGCVVGEGSHVAPGAVLAGGVRIGCRCLIGARSAVLRGVGLGNDVTVGAGGIVARSVASGLTVVGVPALPIPRA